MLKKLTNKFFSLEKDFYQKSVDSFFERDINKDIDVFRSLHPKDDFGRSIAQHKCQVYPFKKDVFKLNSMSFLLLPFVTIMLLMKHRVLIDGHQSPIVCYKGFNYPGSLPEALQNEDFRYLDSKDCPYYLRKSDMPFLLRFCLRSIFHPFLVFRVLIKVSRYRAIIDSFPNLKIIAVTGEFTDTSSAMTQYCRENGIKHYNFMQGEAFGSPRASFFHFDKCYVWDQHYKDMFIGFGATPEQFEVSFPQCLQKIKGNHDEKTIDYTYYLGGGLDEELPIIRIALDRLVEKGYVCEVRPHPKWSNMETIKKVFEGITIQDTSKVNIDQSILQTRNAVSLYSTVLLQSFYNDVNVVIDDLSNLDKFRQLEGYQYIMLNKPHKLFSEITKS